MNSARRKISEQKNSALTNMSNNNKKALNPTQ